MAYIKPGVVAGPTMPLKKGLTADTILNAANNKGIYHNLSKIVDFEQMKKYSPKAYAAFMKGFAKEALSGLGFGAIPQLRYDDSEVTRDLSDLKRNVINLSIELTEDMARKGAIYMGKLTKIDVSHDGPTIIAQSPQWIFLNYGTRPHKIRPKNAKVLKFYPAGASIAVYTTYVNHPGTKKQGFVEATTTYIEREINDYDFK